MSPSNANCHNNGGSCNHANHIKHPVSKMDTLAGVAIKYGVEVADIKRLNGLVTDLQMYALKTLLIPLPGRHPPSPALCSTSSSSPGMNGHDKTPPRPRYSNFLESFESLGMKSTEENISPAMSTLQKFYGIKSSKPKNSSNGTEMAVHRTRSSDFLNGDFLPISSHITGSSNHYLTSRNSADSLSLVAGDAETEKSNEKFVRRRGSSGFSPAKDGLFGVRKSSSTPSLNDQESGNSSSVWPTSKWSLKPDLPALSSAGISIPIFDGLPKPISRRKSKAALD